MVPQTRMPNYFQGKINGQPWDQVIIKSSNGDYTAPTLSKEDLKKLYERLNTWFDGLEKGAMVDMLKMENTKNRTVADGYVSGSAFAWLERKVKQDN